MKKSKKATKREVTSKKKVPRKAAIPKAKPKKKATRKKTTKKRKAASPAKGHDARRKASLRRKLNQYLKDLNSLHPYVLSEALSCAVRLDAVDDARRLLEAGANADFCEDKHDPTLLHQAAQSGASELAALLIAHGANLEELGTDEDGICGSALVAAAAQGHAETVQLLLDSGADPNAIGYGASFEGPALKFAAAAGHPKVVEILAPVTAKSPNRRKLEKATQLREPPTESSVTAQGFLKAVTEGRVKEVRRLLRKGVNVNTIESSEEYGPVSAIGLATRAGHADVVALLIEAGADVEESALANSRSPGHITPLFAAAQNGFADVVRVLAEAGADVNVKCRSGDKVKNWLTPLIAAASAGHLATVRALLEWDAAPIYQILGETAGLFAQANGREEIVDLLAPLEVKELVASLESPVAYDVSIFKYTMEPLAAYGRRAKAAVPKLKQIIEDEDGPYIRSATQSGMRLNASELKRTRKKMREIRLVALETLKAIDPKAAERYRKVL